MNELRAGQPLNATARCICNGRWVSPSCPAHFAQAYNPAFARTPDNPNDNSEIDGRTYKAKRQLE